MKIAPDLFFYPWESYTQNNCNTILITGPVKTLIDPGHKQLFAGLAPKLTADGAAPQDIQFVIHTHCHPDHMEAGEILAGYGAKQALHAADEEYLRKIGPSFYRSMGLKMPEIQVDVNLTEGDLTLGNKTLQVYHTPGHSPGSVCLYWPEIKTLLSGDLIFAQGVGRTDFPGGSGKLLKESIIRMSELDIELILPGHGPAIVGREKVIRNFQVIERMYFGML
ncbi:MAG: MBL fold metallo-hydrolase [Pseudomonadota bacterium]